MTYEKAKAEVISFDEMEIFTITSAQLQSLISSCGAWNCGDFSMVNMETGQFSCSNFDHNHCSIYDKPASNHGHRLYYVNQ